jgi:lipoprotein-anchoring transpeptidase ErfK/SrfK
MLFHSLYYKIIQLLNMNFWKIRQRISWLFLIAPAACDQPQKPPQQQVQSVPKAVDTPVKADSTPIADTTAKTDSVAANQQAMTLPVLDALFYEPDFGKELISKLGLSAVKVAQLKTAAHVSVSELSEKGSPDTASARTATVRYQQQMTSMIGADKARQLLLLVEQRYSQGVEGLAPTQPNFVPKDTRIVVNAPAYRMDVFENGQLIRTYKVGIGYPEFPLPVGMRRADTVIFSPSWTPPDEPWVRGKFAAGRKVSAASKLNPLGMVKIPIGMPSLIHGGKPQENIGKFSSHGCVGLTNNQVLNLVPIILRLGQCELSKEAVRSLEKRKGHTEKVKLHKPVPVDLRYETIVAENDGLHIYRDVYERGTNTVENAKAVLAVYGVKYEQISAAEQNRLGAALASMNRDAHGRPIAAADSPETSNESVPPSKSARAKKGEVTANVKGRTSILVKLAALQGKGYPAPAAEYKK